MKRFVVALGALSSVAIVAGSAVAADLPVKAARAVPVAPPAYNWTGWYAGINGGYGWRNNASALVSDPTHLGLFRLFGIDQTSTPSFNLSGGLVGLQIGYNYQTHPNWLIGFETDIQASWIKGSGSANIDTVFSDPFFGSPPWLTSASTKVKWFGTLRARAGYLPTNNLLLYLTGGLAYGGVERSASVLSSFGVVALGPTSKLFCDPATICYTATEKRTEVGWVAGAGAEYMLSTNLSLKVEYLHVDFGGRTLTLPATQAPSTAVMLAAFNDAYFDLVRIGLNYKFH